VLIGFVGAISGAPAMAGYFSADRRASAMDAMEMLGDDPHGRTAGDSAKDIFWFRQRQGPPRTATDPRSDPSVTRQQKMDDLFILAEYSTNRI